MARWEHSFNGPCFAMPSADSAVRPGSAPARMHPAWPWGDVAGPVAARIDDGGAGPGDPRAAVGPRRGRATHPRRADDPRAAVTGGWPCAERRAPPSAAPGEANGGPPSCPGAASSPGSVIAEAGSGRWWKAWMLPSRQGPSASAWLRRDDTTPAAGPAPARRGTRPPTPFHPAAGPSGRMDFPAARILSSAVARPRMRGSVRGTGVSRAAGPGGGRSDGGGMRARRPDRRG